MSLVATLRPTNLKSRWLVRPRVLLAAVVVSLLAPCLWVVGDTFIEDDNFRVVTADLYRSGQLRSTEWAESLEEHGYRSVLNLRGGKPGDSWYDVEQQFSAEHGLTHYDFPLSANREPSLDDMARLVAIMRAAPKPLLIHCKDGADRSGLVAGLYRVAIEGTSPDTARGQLSLWYGHFPWLTSRTGAMDRALDRFIAANPAH